MSRLIIKKPRARRDLLNHFVYIGQENFEAAERFMEAAEDEFMKLARYPQIGRRWQSPSPRLKDVRVWPIQRFRKYLIFYRPVESGIEMIHVLHGARDIENILESESPDV